MIVGVGTDICQMSRIEKLLKSSKRQAFIERTFTKEEIDNLPSKNRELSYFAGRWAAKEAVAKALGTGFGEHCRWLDICIGRNEKGAPIVILNELTKKTAEELNIERLHLSISHEKEYATAFCVAEIAD